MPLETKKSHQILCRVVKQKNRVTGEERVIVQKLERIDYEFECESLADFAYQLDTQVSNREIQENNLLDSISQMNTKQDIELVKPSQFTYGKMMYSQVKDPS